MPQTNIYTKENISMFWLFSIDNSSALKYFFQNLTFSINKSKHKVQSKNTFKWIGKCLIASKTEPHCGNTYFDRSKEVTAQVLVLAKLTAARVYKSIVFTTIKLEIAEKMGKKSKASNLGRSLIRDRFNQGHRRTVDNNSMVKILV